MKRRIYTVPPKISEVYRSVCGKDVKITIVRDSFICKFFSDDSVFIFGNTIYTKHKILTKKAFEEALREIRDRSEMSTIHRVIRWLTTKD